MKLVYKEYGRYYAYRTHNIDTDELRKYLAENFIDSDVQDLSDDAIENILFYPSDLEDSMTYDKKTGKAYHLADIITDWVQDHLYEDDYELEICDMDMYDDELIEVND